MSNGDIKHKIVDTATESVGLKVTGVGATVTVIGGLTLQDLGIIVGIIVGISGIIIQLVFGIKRAKREAREHRLRIEETQLRIIRLKNERPNLDKES